MTRENARSGVRVVRGFDWSWGDQDGTPGNMGTTLSGDDGDGWCAVIWDGQSSDRKYKIGDQDCYDLVWIALRSYCDFIVLSQVSSLQMRVKATVGNMVRRIGPSSISLEQTEALGEVKSMKGESCAVTFPGIKDVVLVPLKELEVVDIKVMHNVM